MDWSQEQIPIIGHASTEHSKTVARLSNPNQEAVELAELLERDVVEKDLVTHRLLRASIYECIGSFQGISRRIEGIQTIFHGGCFISGSTVSFSELTMLMRYKRICAHLGYNRKLAFSGSGDLIPAASSNNASRSLLNFISGSE
eukprot:IDg12123t1